MRLSWRYRGKLQKHLFATPPHFAASGSLSLLGRDTTRNDIDFRSSLAEQANTRQMRRRHNKGQQLRRRMEERERERPIEREREREHASERK